MAAITLITQPLQQLSIHPFLPISIQPFQRRQLRANKAQQPQHAPM